MLDCSWSTTTVEQQHGSLKVLSRWHPEYDVPSLVLRAFVHAARGMFPSPTKQEKELAKVLDKLSKQMRQNPARVNGVSMYTRELVNELKTRQARLGQPISLTSLRAIFKGAGRVYNSFPDRRKARYDAEATERQFENQETQQATEEILAEEFNKLSGEILQSEKKSKPISVASCKMTAEDMAAWEALFHEKLREVQGLRDIAALHQAPSPPGIEHLKELISMPWEEPEQEATRPQPWLGPLCRLRDEYRGRGAILRLNHMVNHAQTFYKVLWCKKNPLEAMVQELQPYAGEEEDTVDITEGAMPWEEVYLNSFKYKFTYQQGAIKDATDLIFCDLEDAALLLDVVFKDPQMVVSDSEWVPMTEVAAFVPTEQATGTRARGGQGSGSSKDTQANDEAYLEEYPWLEGMTQSDKSTAEVMLKKFPSLAKKVMADSEQEKDPGEELIKEKFEDVASAMAADPEEEGVRFSDFKAALRGGSKALAKSGRWSNCWQGQVVTRGGDADEWCKKVRLQRYKTYPLELGDAPANILCNEWAHRMQQLYNAHLEGGFDTPERRASTLAGIDETPGFVALLGSEKKEVREQAQWIKGLEPKA